MPLWRGREKPRRSQLVPASQSSPHPSLHTEQVVQKPLLSLREETGLCSNQGGKGSLAITLTIFCTIFQMRRAVIPNHSLRCCSMRGHPSCRRCLCAAEGKVLLSPCRTIRIYIHMCLLWEQGRQITMIRVSRDQTIDFGGEPQAIWVRGRIREQKCPLASPWSPPSCCSQRECQRALFLLLQCLEPCGSLNQVPAAFIFAVWSKVLEMSFQHLITGSSLKKDVGKREEECSTLLSFA